MLPVRACASSISEAYNRIRAMVERDELDRALNAISEIVELVFTEPLTAAQVFGSQKLDQLCLEIGSRSYAALKGQTIQSAAVETNVYIVTKLQNSGGHTRVILDIIRAYPEARHIILATGNAGKTDHDALFSLDSAQSNVSLECAPRGTQIEKLKWLQAKLVEVAPKRAYLLNHHNDAAAVAAIQPAMQLDASFLHHADHQLCLGVYLKHFRHVDLLATWYNNCRHNLGIDNKYLPLTIPDSGCPAKPQFQQDGILTTCTAARMNKVEQPYFIRYVDVIPQLLQATGGKHIHIGRLSPFALFHIRRRMKALGVPESRFVYFRWKPSIWKALQELKADLYIDAFPFGAGMTLIEAMGAGIPVVLHKHIAYRNLAPYDLVYPEAYFWRQPEELIAYCRALTPAMLSDLSLSGRKFYLQHHSAEKFRKALENWGEVIPPPERKVDFHVEQDEWSYLLASQISFRHLLWRIAYRLYRRLRAKLSS